MKVVNLTSEAKGDEGYRRVTFTERRIPISPADGKTRYTGMVWNVEEDSMAGSYIDLPGHILETDDGARGDNVNAGFFYRHPASVLHLDWNEGAVHASDLEKAAAGRKMQDFIIVNALGKKNPYDIPNRSIYLDLDAVDWIIGQGCRCLVSDIYESKRLDGVFVKLFAAGVSTVCIPENLCRIPDEVLLTVAFPRWPTTQIPCVLLAEFQE
jgi:hypothetical protein